MHAASREGEDCSSSSEIGTGGEREMIFWCVSLERSDLSYIGTREGGERAAPGAEGNEGDETNRQQPKGAAFAFNLHYSKNFPSPK